MTRTEISTEHLTLVLKTPEETLASLDALSDADRAQVSPAWLARVRAAPTSDPWVHGFSIVHRSSGAVVGNCGYKAPPGPDAVVEIAYGVDPDHRGRGYATEAARALSDFAFASGSVRRVCAHTMPENNASSRVLTKCGFTLLGEVIDPEDGLVWRWELQSPLVGRS